MCTDIVKEDMFKCKVWLRCAHSAGAGVGNGSDVLRKVVMTKKVYSCC